MTPEDPKASEIRRECEKTREWLEQVYPAWLISQMNREQIAWAIACYYVMEERG